MEVLVQKDNERLTKIFDSYKRNLIVFLYGNDGSTNLCHDQMSKINIKDDI